MKKISGNIFDPDRQDFYKGTLFFDNKILSFEVDNSVFESQFVLPGLIDSHIHIESTMLSPIEFSKVCISHGVVAAVTDPHEIANVCGLEGINFMIENSEKTPMKIFTGIPSCVPATDFESSGARIGVKEIEELLLSEKCSHLSEMMNFPGVIYDDPMVLEKIELVKKFGKKIDGHAPLLSGTNLKKYLEAGISTDHECTSLQEALEKKELGMKIMLRESSAARDFEMLSPLVDLHPMTVMFCTDDSHPDDFLRFYIDNLVRRSLKKGYSIQNIIQACTKNPIDHYQLNVGFLRNGDPADFIVVDNLSDFSIRKTFIDGEEVFDGTSVTVPALTIVPINNFYSNRVSLSDFQVKAQKGKKLHVIEIIKDSLLTKHLMMEVTTDHEFLDSDVSNDLLKLVVLNRYEQAKPSIGFVKGFGLKQGAIGTSVAHDSHNIIVTGTDDASILRCIQLIQHHKGGLATVDSEGEFILPLPIAGLMSDQPYQVVASEYEKINRRVGETNLRTPFMTLAFLSLLVIPELKLGDKGLFDVNQFHFIDLQS